jgi:hypothetical protein
VVVEDKILGWISISASIVITLCRGQAPETGRHSQGTMSHDKIKAAARKCMGETGKPYAAARRAAVAGYQLAGARIPPPSAGYGLRMPSEIHDWPTFPVAAHR